MANEVEIINAITGVITYRDLTQDEIKQFADNRAEAQAKAERIAQLKNNETQKKAALLAKLGITEDEVRLLLS